MISLGGPEAGWGIRIGRDLYRDARLAIDIYLGFRKDAELNEVAWRHHWRWSTASLPNVIFRQFYWRGWRIIVPIGYSACGRSRIFWGF